LGIGDGSQNASGVPVPVDFGSASDIPSSVVFATKPSSGAVAGTALAQQPSVEFRDEQGNLVSLVNAPSAVTLSAYSDSQCKDPIASTPSGSAPLSGGITVEASSGVASFSDVSVNVSGEVFLKASASGLVSDCSSAILVSPGPVSAAQSVVSASSPSDFPGVIRSLTLTAKDAYGNLDPSGVAFEGVVFTQSSDDGGQVAIDISLASGIGGGEFGSLFTSLVPGTVRLGATIGGSPVGGSTLYWVIAQGYSKIESSGTSTCTIQSGAAFCWGDNTSGQLGDGSTINRENPVAVSGLSSGVVAISTGRFHSCAVQNGAAKCWGANAAGQLGDGTQIDQLTPVRVSGLSSGVTAISVGDSHTCAIQNGSAKCWGANAAGQLGDGTQIDQLTPVQVLGLGSGVTAITAGNEAFSCAIHNDAAKCWGTGLTGRLGNNSTSDSSVPVQVVGLTSNVSAIDAGRRHACAIQNGNALCWGWGYYGQLGNGVTTSSSVPVAVSGIGSGFTGISAGGSHSCSILGGKAHCWGAGTSGQIGDGLNTSTTTPSIVYGLMFGTTGITSGLGHSCAIVNGAPKCWGNNSSGQLGDGTTNSSLTPVNVSF